MEKQAKYYRHHGGNGTMPEKNYSPLTAKKKIMELRFNYCPSVSDGESLFGEEWEEAKITDDNIDSIHEHKPAGEGDRWFYDIVYTDGTVIRIFNPNLVKYQLEYEKF